MGDFERLVKAAKERDILTIEHIHCGDVFSHIDIYKQQLELTPAGKLAQDGEWEAVELLWRHYGANSESIIFGAILGGHYEEIQKYLQEKSPESNNILANICLNYVQEYQQNEKADSYLTPIIKALEIKENYDEVNALLNQFTTEVQIEYGLLEAAVQGAAFSGNTKRVFELLGSINIELQSDNSLNLLKNLEQIEKSALKAAAQNGKKDLVESIMEICEKNNRIRKNTTIEHDGISIKFILAALTGAGLSGNIELVESLMNKYEKACMTKLFYKTVPDQLILAACQMQQYGLLQKLIEKYPEEMDNIQSIIVRFDKFGKTAHTPEIFSWSYSNNLIPCDENRMKKLLTSISPTILSSHDRYNDVIHFVLGIKDIKLRSLAREAIANENQNGLSGSMFELAEKQNKKALAIIPRIESLQKRYGLFYGHAKNLIDNPELLDAIKNDKIDENVKEDLGNIVGTHCVDFLIDWMKAHQPRALLVDSIERYIEDYEKSWKLYRNHSERAQSLLNVINCDISDDEFNRLIEQQVCLLNGSKSEVVLGKSEDKHNQVTANRLLSSDKFTQAVFECKKQLNAIQGIQESDEDNKLRLLTC